MVDFYGPRGFSVEQIEPHLCVKFQVKQTYSVRGVAFPKLNFWHRLYKNMDVVTMTSLVGF